MWKMWRNSGYVLVSWLMSLSMVCCILLLRYFFLKIELEIIFKKMKLRRYKCFEKFEKLLFGVELLKIIYEDFDVIYVCKC